MPIPISCPHCLKLYRLKDELAGKTVKCQNPDCRKPFPVPVPKSAAEVEADALKALGDEPDQPTDSRVIPITCEMCDHKWDAPWAMQGKNVLCPECRHRNKVPIQRQAKPADWKSGGGKPSMARVEHLEGVVASTDVGRVSAEALREGGAVVEVYESRPISFWLLFVGLPLLLLSGAVYLGMNYFRGKSDAREANYMALALRDQEEAKDAPIPAPEQPLFRGALALAAGEYANRLDDPARLKDALTQFARARQELDGAPPSTGRTILLGELAVAQLGLGGTDDQAIAGTRIRWTPGGRQKLNEKQYNVQAELIDTLATLRRDDKLVDSTDRQAIVRNLVRRAATLGQPTVLDDVIPRLFTDAEAIDGQAMAALEALRAGGDTEAAKKRAGELAPLAAGGSGPFLQALTVAIGPVPGLNTPNPPAPGQSPGDAARQAWTAANLIGKKPDEALEIATRGNNPIDRRSKANALALVAEWADDPKPAIEAAAKVVAEGGTNATRIPDLTLVRLAGIAARVGLVDQTEAFIKATDKPDARAWAECEATRGRLAANPNQPAAADASKQPDDAKDNRAGVAWRLFWVARQTARTNTADSGATYDRWGNGVFRPFGYAGLALGLQDGKK